MKKIEEPVDIGCGVTFIGMSLIILYYIGCFLYVIVGAIFPSLPEIAYYPNAVLWICVFASFPICVVLCLLYNSIVAVIWKRCDKYGHKLDGCQCTRCEGTIHNLDVCQCTRCGIIQHKNDWGNRTCKRCGAERTKICSSCNGDGNIPYSEPDAGPDYYYCFTCDGTGRVW